MPDDFKRSRRSLLQASAFGLLAARFGYVEAATAQVGNNNCCPAPKTSEGQFGPLRYVNAGLLRVAYVEVGPPDGPPVLLFHGWPYDIHSFVHVAPLLATVGYRVLVPYLRGFGETRFLSAATFRNAQPAAGAADAISFMDALKIDRAVVAGFDWGARSANLLALLWPNRVKALVSVGGYLVGSQPAFQTPLLPSAERKWWYLFYFASEPGQSGYARYVKEFNRFIWQQASPKWAFDDETYTRSAKAFDNPDFVRISLHDYRWYLGLAPGEAKYDALEEKIATFPTIVCPTISMQGDSNGAPHADPRLFANKYVGGYEHRVITGGIGHNLPQEAPQAFAKAIIDVDGA